MSVQEENYEEIDRDLWIMYNECRYWSHHLARDWKVNGFRALMMTRAGEPWRMKGLQLSKIDRLRLEKMLLSNKESWRLNYWKTKKYCVENNVSKVHYAHIREY